MWGPTLAAAVVSLTALPITYGYTLVGPFFSPVISMLIAFGIMGAIVGLIGVAAKDVKDKLYYAYALFAFTSVVDLLIALEADGLITGFMSFYLENGEPYLNCVWGSLVAYWDGIVYFSMYLIMAYFSSNSQSYRFMGIHYSASILNSMVVLLLGAFLSKSGVGWCTMLNIPYVVVPILVAVKCVYDSPPQNFTKKANVLDWMLAVLLILAAGGAFLKGLAGLDSTHIIPTWYRSQVEPIINMTDPAPFAVLQSLIAVFYYMPAFIILSIGILTVPGHAWLLDLSLITAGATSQSTTVYFGMPFHPHTPVEFRPPVMDNKCAFYSFWAINIIIIIIPQLVAFRLWYSFKVNACKSKIPKQIKKKGTVKTDMKKVK